MMKRTLLLICAVGFVVMDLWGQATSVQDGPWNSTTTWDCGCVPDFSGGVITLAHRVNIPNGFSVTADEIEFDNSIPFGGITGSLYVDAGGTLIINNGAGDDIRLLNDFSTFAYLEVSGTLRLNLAATIVEDDYGNLGLGATPVTPTTYVITSGGTHQHFTGASASDIPYADYQTGSTFRLIAQGATMPILDPNIPFYNFTWDGTNSIGSGQSATLSLAGNLRTVNGDLTVLSTNGSILQFSTTQSYNLAIGGNFSIQGNTRAQLTVSGTVTVDVGTIGTPKNFDVASTNAAAGGVSLNAIGTVTMNIYGGLLKSAVGSFSASLSSGVTTINLYGDLSITGGTFTKGVTAGASVVNFSGNNSTSNFTNTSTMSGQINYIVVSSTKTLTMVGASPLQGTGNLTNNGTIVLGSPDANGALQTGTTAGNIRISGTRTYATGSTLTYGTGTTAIGIGHPSVAGVNTVINNAAGVALATSVTFNGSLTQTSGNISVGSNTITVGGTLTQGANSFVVTSNSNIDIEGSGNFGVANPTNILNLTGTAPVTVNNFTLNRTGGGAYVFDNLTVAGTFTQNAGNLDIRGFLLTLSGPIVSNGGNIVVNEFARLLIDGTGSITGSTTFLIPGTSPMLALNMDRLGETFNIGPNLDVMQLFLTSGNVNPSGGFRMADGGVITRLAGQIVSTPGAVGSYDVVYNTSTSYTTGPELPTIATRLTNLSNIGTATVTLGQDVTVNGTLTLTNGTFDAGSNAMIFKGNIVSNAAGFFTNSAVQFDGTTVISGGTPLTLGGFVVNSTRSLNLGAGTTVNIAGNVTNNGTITGGTSTAIFNGSTTLTNTNDALLLGSFNNVQITGALTLTLVDFIEPVPDTDLYRIEVSGNWTVTGGTFTAGTSRVDFNGTGAQTITSSGQDFYSAYFLGSGLATLGSALTATNDIMISATSSLDVSASNYQIAVAEDFIVDGTFTARQGTLLLNGIGRPQSITRTTGTGPIDLYNLQVNKTGAVAAVTILTEVDIEHFLTVTSATTVNAGTNLLRLLSTAAATARVTTLGAGAVINGSVIVQRHMPNTAGANSFRYLSAAVTGTTVTDWRNEIPITSIFYYDETFNTSAPTLEARYRTYTLTGALTPQGRGYAAAVNSTAALVFDSRGTLGQGAVPVNVTANSAGGLDGWNLIGNPYPSAIDWNQVTVPAGLNNAIYITDNFNNSGQGTGLKYVSYVDGVPSVQGYAGLIAQGQAFWVRATAPTTVTFQEDDKTTTAAQFFREDSVARVTPNLLRISMVGSGLEDQTVLRLHQPATDGFDAKYDAYKLPNSKLSLGTLTSDNQSLSINSMASLDCDKKIPLTMLGAVKGGYQISFTGLETFDTSMNLYLVDMLQNTSVNIRDVSTYGFTVSATDLPNLSKRFYVTVGKAAVKTDLKTLGESVCTDNTLANVTLEQSQPDVLYAIEYNGQTTDYVKGNGNTISLPVSTSLLTTGDNALTILAKSSSCLTLPLLTKPVITVVGKGVVASTREGNTCDAGSVTLAATGAPDSGWYNWYEGETDTTPIAGQQGASFTTPVIPKTKTYFVSVVNAAGCEGDRVAVKANVTILDPVTLSGEGTTLISSYETGNQWYRDGVVLEGATTNKIEAVESGVYTVEVTSGDCKVSASREVTITASEAGLNGFGTVTIYPNPTQRKALVRVKTTNKDVVATLINASGVDLEERELKGEGGVKEAEFDLGTNAIGVYYVLIVDGSKRYTEKIVKIK